MKKVETHQYCRLFNSLLILFIIASFTLFMSGCSVEINMQDGGNRSIFDKTPGENIDSDELEQFNSTDTEDKTIIHDIDVENIDDDEIEFVSNIGSVIDVYSDDIVISKIILTEALSGMTLRASFNNRPAVDISVGDIVKLAENHYVELNDIIYRNNQSLTVAVLNFISEERESYPDYLIENKIGLNEYLDSEKIDNDTYKAYYDVSMVTVTKGGRFAEKFHDSTKITEFDGDSIYKDPDNRTVSWVSYRGGEEYVIEIGNYTETIIREYFWKYPPHLNSRTLCMRDIELKEGESSTEYFMEDEIVLKLEEISLGDFNARISIDGKERTIDPKDAVMMENTVVILDGIDVTGSDNVVSVCLA